MIEPGTVIDGRYEVLERVGSGGMADVYLASDRLLGRRVAVKVLQHRFAEDAEFVERFKREASSAAGLSHPNVVSIFDRGEWDGTFYIAMEYLPGRTLKDLLRERGPLPPAAAIDVVLQVLRAARFAHRRGVIHRDLKPHNVILDEEGRAKVTDFGIARAGASDMTLTGSIMGTAQYLSPEQAQGQPVTAASDIYAIGVMFYELLVGGVPFDGETAVAIALQHISREPPPPSAVNPAVPPQLDAVVLRMLAKAPAQRFADTSEAISALEQVRAELGEPMTEPVLTAAPHRFAIADAATEQATGELAGGALAPAGAGLLAAYGTPPPPAVGEPPEPPEEQPSRRGRNALLVGALLLLAAIVVALILLLSPSKHVVPDVVEKSEARATAILKRAGFKVVPERATSEHKPKGTVVTETPPAGTEARRGSRVTIVVSSGPGVATVPAVKGLPEDEAKETLHDVDLEPEVSRRPSEGVGVGDAIGTEPKAGTRLTRGHSVILIVSTGPPKVKVPHVVEDSLSDAEAVIEEAGLAVGKVKRRREPGVPAETVLSQSPGAGSLREPSTPVNLIVAKAPPPKKGPRKVSVPDVLEESRAEAEAKLAAEGLAIKVAHQRTTEPERVGYVIEQSPGAGTRLLGGETVTIYVGRPASTTSTTETSTTETASTETSTTSTETSTTEAPVG